MRHIGLNILAQYVNRDSIFEYVRRLQPASVLVMDDMSLAYALQTAMPQMLVIHRAYNPNDHRWHDTTTTPEQWVQNLPSANVVHQLYNEPDGQNPENVRRVVDYCIRAMRAASARGIRLALPNWAVGNPNEANYALLAPLWDAFARHPEHVYAVHEYFNDNPLAEPWHVGRFRYTVGKLPARTQIAVTEYGRDLGGGEYDGWRDTGWTDAAYFARLRAPVETGIYDGIPLMIFCAGAGANGRWRSFDVANADELKTLLTQVPYQEKSPMSFDYGDYLRFRVIATSGQWVNVRKDAGATGADTIVGRINVDDTLEASRNERVIGDNRWRKVRLASGVEGYAAWNLVTAAPIVIAKPDPGSLFVPLTVDELNQIAEHHTAIAAIYTAAIARVGSGAPTLRAQMEAQADADLAAGAFTVYDNPSVFLDGLPLKDEGGGDG